MTAAARTLAKTFDENMVERLPQIRGRYVINADIGAKTWFRTCGVAEVMFRPVDRDDLIDFLAHKPKDVPVTMIGVGSNLLIRDGGVPGVVIRLGKGFSKIDVCDTKVTAGAGALDRNVAQACLEASVSGLEFLSGIPGTIGGALRMNAGAFGREMKDVVLSVEAVDDNATLQTLSNKEMNFSYRHCGLPDSWTFLSAKFQGQSGNKEEIGRKMLKIQSDRQTNQPVKTRTGGSTFANPQGQRAWELIDKAGCRGLTRGGAMVSEKHCNFLINTGTASASDLEDLGEEVRRRVLETSGIELEWEIRRIGLPATPLQEGRAQ